MKLILYIFLFVFLTLITTGIITFFFRVRIFLINDLRLFLQKKIMVKLATTYIKKNKVDSNGKRIPQPDVLTMDMLKTEFENWQCGDIFFTETQNFYAARLTPGKWKHSVVYIGTKAQATEILGVDSPSFQIIEPHYKNEEDVLIFDSSRDGVSVRNINLLSEMDTVSQLRSICLFRPNYNVKEIESFFMAGFKHIGKKYDYDMVIDNEKSIYCAELIYRCLKEIKINIDQFKIILRRKIITPSFLAEYLFKSETGLKYFTFLTFVGAEDYKLKRFKKDELTFLNKK